MLPIGAHPPPRFCGHKPSPEGQAAKADETCVTKASIMAPAKMSMERFIVTKDMFDLPLLTKSPG
jgi:hypothetical protein